VPGREDRPGRYQALPLSAVSGIITDGSPSDTATALTGRGVTVLSP
jgi:hypothetical protein